MGVDKRKYKELISQLEKSKLKTDHPLAEYTTVKIGGPGDIVYRASNSLELQKISKMAIDLEIPITILGGGSNSLISDDGIRGLVIINIGGEYKIHSNSPHKLKPSSKETPHARWELDGQTVRYQFQDLDYDESECDIVKVEVDSSCVLQKLMYDLFEEGLTGLQWYSGIPGTVGGAIFNNIHGGTHFFSEIVDSVHVLTQNGEEKTYSVEEIEPDYNRTIFHDNNDIILSATLNLYAGDTQKAKYVADEWRKRKLKVQPQQTTGCIFANISNEEKERLGFPTTSVGYIIEHELKLTDFRVGNAFISSLHHNFISTDGTTSAKDYLKIIKHITEKAKEKFGIDLICEIIPIGFCGDDLEGVNFPIRHTRE